VPKLHQVLAVSRGVKQHAQQALTDFYQKVQKPEPFAGISRVYDPKDDEGERFPDEYQRVQQNAETMLSEILNEIRPMYAITGDIDSTNRTAAASIIVDGTVVLANVPVATLLWLEKQLADLRTVLMKLPTLDPGYAWTWNAASNQWTSPVVTTLKTKKMYRNHVKAQATDKHPAQVEIFTEDIAVGSWSTKKLSGAMRPSHVKALQARLEKLRDAVKVAREHANTTEVERFDAGAALDWLLSS
jgi:hypothetical protein